MTPKEKAEELVNKFKKEFNWVVSDYDIDLYRDIRQCVIIAVDEAKKCTKYENQKFENDRFSEDYWNLVEQEINKL